MQLTPVKKLKVATTCAPGFAAKYEIVPIEFDSYSANMGGGRDDAIIDKGLHRYKGKLNTSWQDPRMEGVPAMMPSQEILRKNAPEEYHRAYKGLHPEADEKRIS